MMNCCLSIKSMWSNNVWKMNRIRKKLLKSNNRDEDMSFHKSIAFIIIFGQIFALMPFHGVTAASERSTYFTWKSLKVFYAILIIIGSVFCSYSALVLAIDHENNLAVIASSFFYTVSVVDRTLFLLLAKNWSPLVRKWCAIDLHMKSYGYPPHLNIRLKTFSAVLLMCAAVEHSLETSKNIQLARLCPTDDFFKTYFTWIAYPEAFNIIEYTVWAGWMMQIITTISVVSWTYIDLFIILLSTSLAVRFKQVAKRVEYYVNSMVSDIVLWRNVREDYNRLCKLCKAVNDNLSYLILMSFCSNIFFILVQLFYSLRLVEDTLDKVYFFYSFGFIIGRTLCVCLYGAWIHDESQKPLPFLNSVPSSIYNVEIKRFILHAGIETTFLTSKKFFYVSRSIILSVAGTIMTYELVLIQFYGNHLRAQQSENFTCGP